MPIQPLPPSAIRSLTSTQALTDTPSLLKELLDNSLDAASTQLHIELSPNTLTHILLRDNGHGIPAEDRELVALRHHTSKIRTFTDIPSCRTLGFRGEALASTAEMAGTLEITTRCAGEEVAVVLEVGREGVVVGRRNTGAPVGTVVKVGEFLKALPVRRENAIRNAPKTLARVRTLMQRYYLSHPHCRFSLRIPATPQKASGPKSRAEDIVYAPSKSISEAVQKAIGKEVAAACVWIDTSFAEGDEGDEGDDDAITIQAFLPKPDTDPAVICKKPQCTSFLSIDSRPVSPSRGTLKQIHTLFKTYLKSSASAGQVYSDPFIYLNIRCAQGSYDPNIEPAKDDVLFYEADKVLVCVEGLLRRFYGELKVGEKGKGKGVEEGGETQNGFEVLLARKPKTPAPAPVAVEKLVELEDEHWDVDEDEAELAAMAIDTVDRIEGGLVDRWPHEVPEPLRPAPETEDNAVPLSEAVTVPELTEPTPKTPHRKSTTWGFNMFTKFSSSEEEEEEHLEQHASDNEETARKDITLSNPWTVAKINTPLIHSSSPRRSAPTSPDNVRILTPAPSSPAARMFRENRGSVVRHPRGEKEKEKELGSNGSAAVMNSWISRPPRQGEEDGQVGRRSGFVSAAKVYKELINNEGEDAEDDDEDEVEQQQRRQKAPVRVREAPKRTKTGGSASKRPRLDIDNDGYEDEPPRSSPHKNRFLAAAAALQTPTGPQPKQPQPQPQPKLSLSRKSPPLLPTPDRGKKRRRTKTLLPLDAVPDPYYHTHQLTKDVSAGMVGGMCRRLRGLDAYVRGAAEDMVMGGREGEGDFFSEESGWEEVGVVGGLVGRWLLGLARGDEVEIVEGLGWELEEGEERVLRVVEGGVEE